jgi:hypothetical protein
MARGRGYLAAPGEGENEIRRKYDKSFNKPRQAAEAFSKAAPLAPNESARFEAWNEAGKGFKDSYHFPEAYAAFSKARDVPDATAAQRAQAALDAAKTFQSVNYSFAKDKKQDDVVVAEFKKLFAIPNAPKEVLALGHRELGSFYHSKEKYLEAALEYEAAAPLVPSTADSDFDSATYNVEKLPPSPQTLAIIERIYKTRLTMGKSASQTDPANAAGWRKYYRRQWAEALIKQKAPARAIAVWNEVANDATIPLQDRFEVLQKIAQTQQDAKDYTGTVATYERIRSLPGVKFSQVQVATYGKVEAYENAKSYSKARDQLASLLTNAEATVDQKANALIKIGSLHRAEANQLRVATAKAAQPAASEKEAIASFEAALATEGISNQTKYSALLERIQVEADGKRMQAAHDQVTRGQQLFKTEAAIGYLRGLQKVNARLYRFEKDYTNALASLSLASFQSTPQGVGYRPDAETQQLASGIYQETLANKNWDAARQTVAELQKWGLMENDRLLMLSRIEVEAGNFEVARPMLQKLPEWYTKSDAHKKVYADVMKKMPPTPTPALQVPSTTL